MSPKTITFGLLWHSMNSDNLGVGALTVSHIAIIEDACRKVGVTPRFIVIGWTDPRPFYFARPDIEIVQLRMKDFIRPGGLWRTFRRCDAVLDIGGGDSFADIYGAGRIWRMLLGQNMAMLAGRPLVLSPQTIGPFTRGWARRLALNVMRRAKAVASRDILSIDFAREAGFKGAIIEASDVAFRLPYDAPPPRPPAGATRVGVNVSGLLVNGGYTGGNMFGLAVDYPKLVRAMLDYFSNQPDCELHLVGHVISRSQEVEDDYRASLKLAEAYPNARVAPAFETPSEAKSYIAGMDFFVGARMHACIAAISSGVPVMPTAYSRKFAGVFGAVGYEHCADCKTDDADTILEKIRSAYANRAALKADADAASRQSLTRLKRYDDWLESFVGGLA